MVDQCAYNTQRTSTHYYVASEQNTMLYVYSVIMLYMTHCARLTCEHYYVYLYTHMVYDTLTAVPSVAHVMDKIVGTVYIGCCRTKLVKSWRSSSPKYRNHRQRSWSLGRCSRQKPKSSLRRQHSITWSRYWHNSSRESMNVYGVSGQSRFVVVSISSTACQRDVMEGEWLLFICTHAQLSSGLSLARSSSLTRPLSLFITVIHGWGWLPRICAFYATFLYMKTMPSSPLFSFLPYWCPCVFGQVISSAAFISYQLSGCLYASIMNRQSIISPHASHFIRTFSNFLITNYMYSSPSDHPEIRTIYLAQTGQQQSSNIVLLEHTDLAVGQRDSGTGI